MSAPSHPDYAATALFEDVCSTDFLGFNFGQTSYQNQLNASISKTGALSAITSYLLTSKSDPSSRLVWVSHDFSFLGGSLGCAEGEKITQSFEYALSHRLPIVVVCRTGGARMQEGTSSLMQMAKVSVAVAALSSAGVPFLSVEDDPTFGGVSASYAMQADVRIGRCGARIGFAGPSVILTTMCNNDQQAYDKGCPADFQSAEYLYDKGQVDMVREWKTEGELVDLCAGIAFLLHGKGAAVSAAAAPLPPLLPAAAEDMQAPFNYSRSRLITRPQAQDLIQKVFPNFVELSGDGKVGRDVCLKCGLANGPPGVGPVAILATFKGHTPGSMQAANYGMPSPHGYRTAHRIMRLAERFGLPVVTMVDTVGAWPTFDCERDGQSEAIASNLTLMGELKVPIVTMLVGEGGSGGALGIGMGNVIGMLSGGYFGVISPEGAASILGRYKDDKHKALQFPIDCQTLAKAQGIYADQLKGLGVVDEIIWEKGTEGESFDSFPVLEARVRDFITRKVTELKKLSPSELVAHRYSKFRKIGTFKSLPTAEEREQAVAEAKSRVAGAKERPTKADTRGCLLSEHLAKEIVTGAMSRYRGLAAASCGLNPPEFGPKVVKSLPRAPGYVNAKSVLDSAGPKALAEWVKIQSKTRVLLTDTTMRDAHQSNFATRARTEDLVKGAVVADVVLRDAFSFECWGGATFDVAMRFLDECPWQRLRELRAAAPNVCLQMLIRGANAVGYKAYPDNAVSEFVRLAALNGMDVFRIFDCFNDIENMRVTIDAVIKANKVAEVCLCYTGDVLTSSVYNLEYYKGCAKAAATAGAHFIGIKDMAGLLKPIECAPLLKCIRSVCDLPIHYHTHATSGGSMAVCFEMAKCGCDVIDFCTASMADGTSQPSLNAFIAMMAGGERDTGINYLDLEPYDIYWQGVRDMYSPFESGMKSGSARVFEHQIPGGQYSNLYAQCQSMGLMHRWGEVLDSYRDVNQLFGDIVKVTPSSKCVGDLSLYLITRNLTTKDIFDPKYAGKIDFPASSIELMKGDLGFPHRGFPKDVEEIILKGDEPRKIRAGLTLELEDFSKNIATLSAKWGRTISEEEGMSSIMYPQVFADYMKRRAERSSVLRHLPTPIYLYAMEAGQSFTIMVPKEFLGEVVKDTSAAMANAAGADFVPVKIELLKVSSLQKGCRTVVLSINGGAEEHHVSIKDTTGKFVFEGKMADSDNPKHVASPMPGIVEKVLVKKGDAVKAGDVLTVVSAMKMEVKSTAPCDGVVAAIEWEVGSRVVEGCLLVTLK